MHYTEQLHRGRLKCSALQASVAAAYVFVVLMVLLHVQGYQQHLRFQPASACCTCSSRQWQANVTQVAAKGAHPWVTVCLRTCCCCCRSFGPKNFIIISDPGYTRQILQTNADKYSKGILRWGGWLRGTQLRLSGGVRAQQHHHVACAGRSDTKHLLTCARLACR